MTKFQLPKLCFLNALFVAFGISNLYAETDAINKEDVFVRDVFVATESNPRYSEGSIVPLANGSLLYATTEFIGSGSDFAKARIVARRSNNGGRDWEPPYVLQENIGQMNVMSVSLCPLSDPKTAAPVLGFFYLQKNSPNDLKLYVRHSYDEGQTFGEASLVTDSPAYHVMNNDRITRLSGGRLLAPIASTNDVHTTNHFISRCFVSDDSGKTWHMGKGTVDYAKRGAMEPEVLELKDGRVLMQFRTQLGHIAVAYSNDAGESWSTPEPWGVRSPEAPATLRKIPTTGDLLLVWNDNFTEGEGHGGRRAPLTAAISTDEGKTWVHKRNLESDAQFNYAYTSLCFHEGRALMSYYVEDTTTGKISSRFRSVPISWFYAQE